MESVKREGGEEEEWRHGQVRLAASACGCDSLAGLGFLKNTKWSHGGGAWLCVGLWVLSEIEREKLLMLG